MTSSAMKEREREDDDLLQPLESMSRAGLLQLIDYYQAQDDLLTKAQEEAQKLRDDLAEVQRPLDAQMARLNARVIELTAENDSLKIAALSQSKGEGWMPIETAPKDRMVLVCIAGLAHSAGEAWYQAGSWRTHDGIHPRVTTYTTPPTHWQPIPALPPAPSEQGDQQ